HDGERRSILRRSARPLDGVPLQRVPSRVRVRARPFRERLRSTGVRRVHGRIRIDGNDPVRGGGGRERSGGLPMKKLVVLLALTACESPEYPEEARANTVTPAVTPQASKAPTCREKQKSYTGFGGTQLTATRPSADPLSDRGRVKPFSALAGEYA